MSTKKHTPNYSRQPAAQLILEKRVEALSQTNANLLQLIAAHFPAAQQDVMKVGQAFARQVAQIDALEGELLLRGHGPRGVQDSLKLQTKGDNEKFLEKLVKASDEPLAGEQLIEVLGRYLQVESQQGRGWVVPDESMYGQLVKDGSSIGNTDLMELADGLYLVKNEEQTFYTLKITLEDGVLIFSPQNGPSIVTWSDLERQWIQHTAWQFANGPKAVASIEKFFSASNLNDVTSAELLKLATTLRKMPEAKLQGLVQFDENGMSLALNPIFKVVFPNEGEATIVGTRDDIAWTDLTLYTRRTIFRQAKARVDQVNAESAPKAAAKKAAKKTSAKK